MYKFYDLSFSQYFEPPTSYSYFFHLTPPAARYRMGLLIPFLFNYNFMYFAAASGVNSMQNGWKYERSRSCNNIKIRSTVTLKSRRLRCLHIFLLSVYRKCLRASTTTSTCRCSPSPCPTPTPSSSTSTPSPSPITSSSCGSSSVVSLVARQRCPYL